VCSIFETENYTKIFIIPEEPYWGAPLPILRSQHSIIGYNYDRVLSSFLKEILFTNKTNKLGEILSHAGVGFVLVNANKDLGNILISRLHDQLDLRAYFTMNSLHIYKNTQLTKYLYPCTVRVISLKGLDTILSIFALNLDTHLCILFINNEEIINELLTTSNAIIGSDGIDIKMILLTMTNINKTSIKPSYYTYHHRPSIFWSKAYTSDPLHGEWHPYLKEFNIENWQFDYGHGLVFTWAKFHIPTNLHPSDKNLVKVWTFDKQDDCSSWRRYTSSKQFNVLQNLMCCNGILEVKLYNSTWDLKTINSPLIPIDFDHIYQFIIRIRGVNVHKVHVKVAEFDSSEKLINIKHIKDIGDGNFSWREVVFNYIPSNDKIRYVQLQICHNYLTDKPLPNIIMIDYVKVYDVTRYAKRVTLDIPFDVRSGEYKIFVRCFENQKGGTIRIYLDSKLIAQINTTSQLNRFIWKNLGTYRLETGRHMLVLENVKGFNAVNIFLVIPVKEYSRLIKELEDLLKNNTIIYLFEAESDMFRTDAKIIKNTNASNGEALFIEPSGYAWRKFEVIREGYYVVAVRMRSNANVTIDGKNFNLSSNTFKFCYIGPIYLSKGIHTIWIETTHKPLYLDVVWIYSVKSSSSRITIKDLFKVREKPAKVISYRRIDPTLWNARVIAKKPFMLVFAETYDSLWEARVYKNGELVERVRSIPVYYAINGFWINATGDLTIVIRYVPQDWFELGLKISATTFTLCIFYLIWDWRRSRGDRWALGLEKVFRRALTLARK